MDLNKVYLTQTDTTVGLLSGDYKKLNKIKNRPVDKPVLMEVDSLSTLKNFTRVPKRFKKMVRRAKRTTFIYSSGNSYRVVKDKRHLEFLKKFKWLYSTSANRSGERFDESWARSVADVVVEDKRGFFEGEASKIYKLGKNKIKRVR